MPGVLHLGAVSSSSEVAVRLSVLPSSFHLVSPFSSKNMKGGGNKNTFPASRNVSSEQQSASARERIFYNKVADHLQILTRAVAIVKKCRDLGIGCGGFFRPGYRDGAKLHLQMMCLGKNWNPEDHMKNVVLLIMLCHLKSQRNLESW
ncbi:hypothetical protein HPP92_012637 [Vanilla planifolia]|uniref:Uncharacterized protein n=1 Tax=Vanilla planifolia TaxID=51239 RepID=A0A835UZJ6_VANPL|nr:hypothetical protein HPP92_012637 [Vanilla planifolia]